MSGEAPFEAWVNLHRTYPWPENRWSYAEGTPAQALYDDYVAYMASRGDDRRVLTHNEFGPALVEAGFRKYRAREGYLYAGLLVESRPDRAHEQARITLTSRANRKALDEHKARVHGPGAGIPVLEATEAPRRPAPCQHRMPTEVEDRIAAEVEAALPAYVEETYGPYLRWHPGSTEFADRAQAALEARMAELPGQIAEAKAQLADAEAALARGSESVIEMVVLRSAVGNAETRLAKLRREITPDQPALADQLRAVPDQEDGQW